MSQSWWWLSWLSHRFHRKICLRTWRQGVVAGQLTLFLPMIAKSTRNLALGHLVCPSQSMLGCQFQHLVSVQHRQTLNRALRMNGSSHCLLVEMPQLHHCLLFQSLGGQPFLASQGSVLKGTDQVSLVSGNSMSPLVQMWWIVLDAPARRTLGDGHGKEQIGISR